MVAENKHFRKAKIFCGSYKPYGLLSSKNELWVKFKTDESKQDKGFYLSYIAVGMLFVLPPMTLTRARQTGQLVA